MKKLMIKLLYGPDATELKPFEVAVIDAVAQLVPPPYQERIAQQIPLNDHIQRLAKGKDVLLYQSKGIFGGGSASLPETLALPGPEVYCLGKARIKSRDSSVTAQAAISVVRGKVFSIVFDREPRFGADFHVSGARLIFDFAQMKTPVENLDLPDSYRELVTEERKLPHGWKLLSPDEVDEVAEEHGENLVVIARQGVPELDSPFSSALVGYNRASQQFIFVKVEDDEHVPITTDLRTFFETHGPEP